MPQLLKHKRGPQLIVGLMSGTSADGIDAVVARISGTGRGLRAEIITHLQSAFSSDLRAHILKVCLHGTVAEICQLNFLLGEYFARAALAVIKKAGLKATDIAAIGSHGQTIHHLPRAKTPSTLQIGEAAVIAERTGILTVADFRVSDMAAGGQGAPLVPYVDWALQTHATRARILQNIGGIANLTLLPPKANLDDILAFDTGPGNMVMDAVVNQLSRGRISYDRNGQWAAQGRVNEKLLHELMQHPFLAKQPPKTTGREEFGERFVRELVTSARRLKLSDADIICTATAFTATSIAQAYEKFVYPLLRHYNRAKVQIILGGGGAKNRTLREMLAAHVSPVAVLTQEDVGGSNEGKEALAFAILAHETLQGRPSNAPGATGAKRTVILGKIVLP